MKIILKPMGMWSITALILVLGGMAIVRHGRADATQTAASNAAPSATSQPDSDSVAASGLIYGDAMAKGWEAPGWSWAKDVNYDCTDVKFSGAKSIRIHLKQYEGVKFHHGGPLDLSRYDRLAFHVRGGTYGLSGLMVKFANDGTIAGQFGAQLAPTPAQEWATVVIPLSTFGLEAKTPVDEFWLQGFAQKDQHFYVDDIRLLAPGEAAPAGDLVPVTQQPAGQ